MAHPRSTAIPDQTVARADEAPDISPVLKNQININGGRFRYLANQNRYYPLILAKRPRSEAENSSLQTFTCISFQNSRAA